MTSTLTPLRLTSAGSTRMFAALGHLRRRPVTLAVVATLSTVWVVSLASGSHGLFAPGVAGLDFRTLQQHRWWALVVSWVDAGALLPFLVALAAAIVGIGVSERLMGSRRTAIAFVAIGLAASAGGVGLVIAGMHVGEFWSTSVREVPTLDPLTPIAGTLAWASAWAGALWRRRLRTVLVAASAALLLYSGQPADLNLVLAVGLGIAAGALLHRPTAATTVRWRGSRHETRALLAIATAILAVGPVLMVLSAARYGVLSPLGVAVSSASSQGYEHDVGCAAGRILPGCVTQLRHLPLHSIAAGFVSVLPLALMLVCARGLLAGRRAAVVVLAVLTTAEALLAAWFLGVVPAAGLRYAPPFAPQRHAELALWFVVSALVPLALAVVLVLNHRAFPVRIASRSVRRYLVAVAAAVAVPSALFLGLASLLRTAFRPIPSFGDLVADLPQRFIPIELLGEPLHELRAVSLPARIVADGVGPMFWLTVVAATFWLLRGRADLAGVSSEALRTRQLLARGSGTLGFMSTWAGNRLWVDPSGDLGIAYRVVNGYAVTTSDPIGRAADPEAAISAFLSFCDESAWVPVFYSVHEEWRTRLAARGWASIAVAEETAIDPRAFTLEGTVMHDVRYSVNRATREGTRAVWGAWQDLPPKMARQIIAMSEQWMSDKELPELSFTLGGTDELRDHDVLVGVAVDVEGNVLAVTSWLPVRRDGALIGRTLDFMRRSPRGANGVMEFLIADGIRRARDEGLEIASLSGSPLAGSGDASGQLAGVLALVSRMLEPVYGFSSLLRFKRKFSPRLDPMYLLYRDPVQLPGIGLAIARCYLPTMTLAQATRAFGRRG